MQETNNATWPSPPDGNPRRPCSVEPSAAHEAARRLLFLPHFSHPPPPSPPACSHVLRPPCPWPPRRHPLPRRRESPAPHAGCPLTPRRSPSVPPSPRCATSRSTPTSPPPCTTSPPRGPSLYVFSLHLVPCAPATPVQCRRFCQGC